jgi:hypothetical protein
VVGRREEKRGKNGHYGIYVLSDKLSVAAGAFPGLILAVRIFSESEPRVASPTFGVICEADATMTSSGVDQTATVLWYTPSMTHIGIVPPLVFPAGGMTEAATER